MKVNDILKNKKNVLLYVIIIVGMILLVLFTILFNTTNIEAYVILFVSNLIIGIIALTIPFVMKNIEKKEKQEEKQLKKKKREVELIDRIKTVINELKVYFEILISSKYPELPKYNLFIPPQFQFFKSIGKKEPEFLKKLGIDIELFTTTSKRGTQIEGATLIILNIYRLRGGCGNQPYLNFISTDVEYSEIPYDYEFLLKEIVENAEKNFSITLDKDLRLLSNNIKSSYEEVSKPFLRKHKIK